MASDQVDAPCKLVPDDIKLDSSVVDVCFHPDRDVVAACTVGSEVLVYSYSNESNHLLLKLNHHKKPCRGVQFSHDGSKLFSISVDRSIQAVDMTTGATVHKIVKAHESPIYSFLVIDDYLLATGDDDGVFKVWDYRRATPIFEQKQMEDYISCMTINEEKKILLATSGEGTLTAFNVRAKRMELQSEPFDSEMLSVSIIKRGTKAVVGDGEGVFNIFNWGEFGNISDRFPENDSSVDCMIPITENIVCTGSIDGKLRAVNLLPNRVIGIVGEHEDFPIESLSLSKDKKLLASCSQDETIKFWDIGYLHKEKVSDKNKAKASVKKKHLKSSKTNPYNFFSGLESTE
uniref:WD repeat-containing protein 55 homolog n=1 Tax=Strigamia maritima TaxID=126957 RepID=T1IPJ2_STRMM